MNRRHMELTGWGRVPASAADVAFPTDVDELAKAAHDAGPRGAITRGLARSYGDAAQRAGGLVVDATRVTGILDFDDQDGVVRVLAGTSLDELLRVIVPRGWFVRVTPGTRFVTIGGMIASDVHGKNHHTDGAIGLHVRSLVLALADGTRRTLTPNGTPAEFWATCGGMGLTGAILEATLVLRRIESSRLLVDTDRVRDLDDLLDRLRSGGDRYRYAVAWIDLLARGRNLGRSVLTQGDFAPAEALDARHRDDPLRYGPRPPLPMPSAPNGLLNRMSIQAFNELWFRKAPRHRTGELQSIATFFHPLDMLAGWNKLYGPRGFVQWQCVLPFGQEAVLRRCVEALSRNRTTSFLAVLKTMGEADPAPLSFPAPGWTLALDVPAGSVEVATLLRELDRDVADAGGRIYLAKDSHMDASLVPIMYPRLDEWREVRDRLDPQRRCRSDLGDRLRLMDRG
ncbi:MAG TPA: FAD-binding oxidoreductase [Acidimicrobiales bacterium]|nr:FAD-binding oxidoreductase [Acidimicrobiales bacterium]